MILENNLGFHGQYFESSESSNATQSVTTQIDVLTTPAQFYELENEWNSLLSDSSSNSIFLTWEWVSTWWKYFQNNTELWIIVARDAITQELTGIAPLAVKMFRNIAGINQQRLIFLGNGFAAPDHLDFIIRNGFEERVTQLFSDKIWNENHRWNEIRIGGLISTSSVVYQLLQQHSHLLKNVDRSICPYISLPEDWDTYNQSLSKNMRYNLGRFKRRLERDYPEVTKVRQLTEQNEIKDFISTLVRLHTASQKRKNNAGLFTDQNMIDFHMELAEIFLKNGWLRSYTLNIGNTNIAAIHCFQYNNVVSFYQSGFDQFWQKYSPGSQIMMHAIQQAINEKNKTFDFLRGDESYKFKWTKNYSTNLSFNIPLRLQNQAGLYLKQIGRKLITQL